MSAIKNQLITCRECGFEIQPGEGILLCKDPKTGDEDWVCCMTCNMGWAGVDYADVYPANPEPNDDNPGYAIGE
jgi:hypothetical protein